MASHFTAMKWAKVETFHLMRGGHAQKGASPHV
jgi:hypothetical protein